MINYSISFIIRSGAAVMGLVGQWILIKYMGEDLYGQYVKFIAQISAMAIFVKLGTDVSMARAVVIYFNIKNNNGIISIINKSIGTTFMAASLLIVILLAIDAMMIYNAKNNYAVIWASLFVLVLGANFACVARSMDKILVTDLVDNLIRPVLLCVFVYAGYKLNNEVMDKNFVAILYIISSLIVVILLFLLIKISIKNNMPDVVKNNTSTSDFKVSLPVIMSTMCSYALFQLDTLILSENLTSSEVGLYNVACNYVRLVIFFPMILVSYAQPKFATMFYNKNIYLLKREVLKISVTAALWGVVILIIFILFGEKIMTITSLKYADGGLILIILSVGHIFNSISLVVGSALNMSKLEVEVFKATAVGAGVAIFMYIILIPKYGSIGGAIAASAGMFSMTAMLTVSTKKIAY